MDYPNYPKVIGTLVAIFGLVVGLYAISAMNGMTETNPAVCNQAMTTAQKAACGNDKDAVAMLVGGIILLVVGGGVAIYSKKN